MLFDFLKKDKKDQDFQAGGKEGSGASPLETNPEAELDRAIDSGSGLADMPRDTSQAAETGEKIAIFTMPEKFRMNTQGADNAKTIGVVILLGGALVLVALILIFYFLWLKPKEAPLNRDQGVNNELQNDMGAASSSAEDIAASSTPDSGTQEPVIATTTDESLTASTTEAETATSSQDIASTTTSNGETTEENGAKVDTVAPADTDSDGLSDQEEELIGTNINNSDSDGDHYLDINEFLNQYNPVGSGLLATNANFKKFDNTKYGYSLYQPASWKTNELGDADTVIFQAQDNQFIQIIVQDNSEHMAIDEWYRSQTNPSQFDSSQKATINNWSTIKTSDGLIVYMTDPGRKHIYVFNYNPGKSGILNYKNVFQMMINSLISSLNEAGKQ